MIHVAKKWKKNKTSAGQNHILIEVLKCLNIKNTLTRCLNKTLEENIWVLKNGALVLTLYQCGHTITAITIKKILFNQFHCKIVEKSYEGSFCNSEQQLFDFNSKLY